MKAFAKAILLSFRYKWTIIGSIVCSSLVAVLWSASISTVFPVVKIVLENKTAHSWVSEEIEKAKNSRVRIRDEVDDLRASLNGLSEAEAIVVQNKIDLKEERIASETEAIELYEWYQPYIKNWAPASPFTTERINREKK